MNIWEQGQGKPPVEQALLILSAGYPQAAAQAVADLSIGQRDACLLRLHELTFGSQLSGVASCPQCHEQLEIGLDSRELVGNAPEFFRQMQAGQPPFENQIPTSVSLNGFEILFRLPNSADLTGTARATSATELLKACLVSAHHDGSPIEVSELPETVIEAIGDRMAAMDHELARGLTLSLSCPACSHQWAMLFDIVPYFWSEINAWAMRLMREVHTLAMVYGWREADILNMSAWRRQRYLELIGS